jgi:hypothetical protein
LENAEHIEEALSGYASFDAAGSATVSARSSIRHGLELLGQEFFSDTVTFPLRVPS